MGQVQKSVCLGKAEIYKKKNEISNTVKLKLVKVNKNYILSLLIIRFSWPKNNSFNTIKHFLKKQKNVLLVNDKW